jgi:HEAT repeat protein
MSNKIFILTLLFSILILSESGSIQTSQKYIYGSSEQAKQLNQAIKNLRHPKKIVRRQAAHQISHLIATPGIQRAIRPLGDVLLNKGIRSGIFTQEIVAVNLGRIAAHLGSPEGDHSVEVLIECMVFEEFDSVRASAATALGLSMNELALVPLQYSLENDPSPIVKYAAQEALNRLARNGIQLPEGELAQSSSSSNPNPAFDESIFWEYQKDHIIYSNPPLEEELWQ